MDDEQRTQDGAAGPEAIAPPRASALAIEIARLAPGRSVFAGDLSAVTPPDLLNFLHQGRRTGVLIASHGELERAVVLENGAVAWAASTSPGERFGEIVCRLGILPRVTIQEMLAEQTRLSTPRRLGELLAQRGLIDLVSRTRALRHQIIEIFLGLLVLREGQFNFRAGFDAARLPSRLSLDVEGLLLDGLRRLDEMDHYRTRIRSGAFVPVRTGRQSPPETNSAFSLEMHVLLEQIDGMRSLAELAELTALGEFEATKAAWRLMQAGYLVPAEAEPDEQSTPSIQPPPDAGNS